MTELPTPLLESGAPSAPLPPKTPEQASGAGRPTDPLRDSAALVEEADLYPTRPPQEPDAGASTDPYVTHASQLPSSGSDSPPGSLSSNAWEELRAAVERFEAAWASGRPPRLEEHWPVGPGRPLPLLVELALIDLEWRLKAGTSARAEDYLGRFPELAHDRAAALSLIGREFVLRRRNEPQLDPNEYQGRFPQLGADLADHLVVASTGLALPAAGAGASELLLYWDEQRERGQEISPEQLCRHCPEHLDEVRRRVAALQSVYRALEGRAAPKDRSVPPASAAVGRPQVPGYEILSELGRGGMGVVYKARQVALKRLVALKMILAGGHASTQELSRFRAEAEAVARLQHPHIVQVYEVGEHYGLPFFSLELCPGGSLAQKLKHNPLPPVEAARLVELLTRGVQAAHDAKLIHRDLKPANVLLGADGTPKVTDFGLAKRLDEVGQTWSGAVMGTPAYMPPEQAQGKTDAIGPAADVYALGAILYECLTGRPPFKAATVIETIRQVLDDEPVPVRQLQPKVPRDLETICHKCLQKEQARRYASAHELGEDLRRLQNGEPIRARPVGFAERAAKWARRKPAQAFGIVTALLAVLGGVAGLVSYSRYRQQRAESELERVLQHDQAVGAVAEAADLESQGKLALAQGWEEKAAGYFEDAKAHFDSARTRLDAVGAADDEELRRAIAQGWERVDRAVRQFNQERAEQKLREKCDILLRGLVDLSALDIGFIEGAREASRERIRRKAPALLALFQLKADRPAADAGHALDPYRQKLASWNRLAEVATACHDLILLCAEAEADAPGQAAQGARKALQWLDMADALGRTCNLTSSRTYHVRRARYLARAGDHAGALEAEARARQLEPRTALDRFLLAVEDYRQGQYGRARQGCNAVLEDQRRHFGAQYLIALCDLQERKWSEARVGMEGLFRQHSLLWPLLLSASAGVELQDYARAEREFSQALQMAGQDPLQRYLALTNRSALWARLRNWGRAEADLAEAITLRPNSAPAYMNLAIVQQARGQSEKALNTLDKALEHRPTDGRLQLTRGQFLKGLGRREPARLAFEKALTCVPSDARSPWPAQARVELAHLRYEDGDYPSARREVEAALKVLPDDPRALLQRTNVLLKLEDYDEASRTLERYLTRAKPDAAAYRARGLLFEQRRDFPAALRAYNRALEHEADARTLSDRGWVYLRLDAARLALADFEEALKRQGGIKDARQRAELQGTVLCGRAHARVQLGQVADAVVDAEDALKQGRPSARLLLNAACVYGRAAGRLRPEVSARPADRERYATPQRLAQFTSRAVELVEIALQQVADGRERADFWRRYVADEPSLVPVGAAPALLRLRRYYASTEVAGK
jgi:tetratricopeptide (TPR) repeat protein